MRMQGKVALITGGNSGIGRSIVDGGMMVLDYPSRAMLEDAGERLFSRGS